jgi:hypothetical protein
MEDVLEVVRGTLTDYTSLEGRDPITEAGNMDDEDAYGEPEERWDNDANDMVFDDTGEGAGVEGDLDMEDD